MTNVRAGIVVEGVLKTYSQEGGFAADFVLIDDLTITDTIAELFGVTTNDRGSLGDNRDFGRVRLTLERSYDAAPIILESTSEHYMDDNGVLVLKNVTITGMPDLAALGLEAVDNGDGTISLRSLSRGAQE